MWKVLYTLFSMRKSEVSFLVIDDTIVSKTHSYKIKIRHIIEALLIYSIVLIVFVVLLLTFTPLGIIVYDPKDIRMRLDTIALQERLDRVEQEVKLRDRWIHYLKEIVTNHASVDTLLEDGSLYYIQEFDTLSIGLPKTNGKEVGFLHNSFKEKLSFYAIDSTVVSFPTHYPLKGTVTRGYLPSKNHFGLDISAREETPFHAIAQGTVVHHGWSVEYGYVLHIQHPNGLLSIYKHARDLNVANGQIVDKGAILGVIGDVGLLSSGSHLHIEIWKNGLPQNPKDFFF